MRLSLYVVLFSSIFVAVCGRHPGGLKDLMEQQLTNRSPTDVVETAQNERNSSNTENVDNTTRANEITEETEIPQDTISNTENSDNATSGEGIVEETMIPETLELVEPETDNSTNSNAGKNATRAKEIVEDTIMPETFTPLQSNGPNKTATHAKPEEPIRFEPKIIAVPETDDEILIEPVSTFGPEKADNGTIVKSDDGVNMTVDGGPGGESINMTSKVAVSDNPGYLARRAIEKAITNNKRNAYSDRLLGNTNRYIAELESKIKISDGLYKQVQITLQHFKMQLQQTKYTKATYRKTMETLMSEMRQIQQTASEEESRLQRILTQVQGFNQQCRSHLLSSQQIKEKEKYCEGFDGFMCQNGGRCSTRINHWDHRMEPYCQCKSGFTGGYCETHGAKGQEGLSGVWTYTEQGCKDYLAGKRNGVFGNGFMKFENGGGTIGIGNHVSKWSSWSTSHHVGKLVKTHIKAKHRMITKGR